MDRKLAVCAYGVGFPVYQQSCLLCESAGTRAERRMIASGIPNELRFACFHRGQQKEPTRALGNLSDNYRSAWTGSSQFARTAWAFPSTSNPPCQPGIGCWDGRGADECGLVGICAPQFPV